MGDQARLSDTKAKIGLKKLGRLETGIFVKQLVYMNAQCRC